MISGYHDLYLRPWFTLRVFALPVAIGSAPGVQVVVSDICQFDALEDPEDRPPSVLNTILSGTRAVRGSAVAIWCWAVRGRAVLGSAVLGSAVRGSTVRGWAPVIQAAR